LEDIEDFAAQVFFEVTRFAFLIFQEKNSFCAKVAGYECDEY
jgi:hypothetical protein